MAVLIGIDEAGYGPLLGPLVVSSFAMSLPDEDLKSNHWQILSQAVSREKRNLRGRVLITDSKKAFNRKSGLGHLESTSLCFLKQLGYNPANTLELLEILCPECLERVAEYQWYQNLDKHLLDTEKTVIDISSSVLSKTMKKFNFEVLGLKSVCMDVGYYNSWLDKLDNKSAVVFMTVCSFISEAFEKHGKQNLQIIVDRQGGRKNYTRELMKMFPDVELKVIKETDMVSSYSLSSADKNMKIHFAVKADLNHIPVCVSSIVSKFVRELLMEKLNQYFIEYSPHLKPTAGYWTDGQRFLKDIQKHCPSVKYEKQMLVRSK